MEEIPVSHRVYLITGFVVSGYLFYVPGSVKLPNENIKKWEVVKLPTKSLKPLYIWLEFCRKVKQLLKGLRRVLWLKQEKNSIRIEKE